MKGILDTIQAAHGADGTSEAARQFAAELEMIIDSVPAMIFYKDLDHRLVRANAAMVRTLGKSREQLIGKTDAELGTPYAEQYARDEDQIAATGKPKLGYVEPLMTPAGVRWLQTDKVPLRDADGKVTGFIGLAVDVTERKWTEEALRASEADFRASFHSTAVGQAQVEPISGRYMRVNMRFSEITGYSEDELLRMTFHDVTHPDDREEDNASHEQLVNGEVVEISREKRYVRKDGRIVWISINASLIYDAAGQPWRTLAVVQDITGRRRAEEARLAAEAKYRQLVEQSLAGIYVIQGSRFTYVNPRMAEIFGCTPDEMTSVPVLDFIAPEDRLLAKENIRRRLDGEVNSVRYSLHMLRKDGTVVQTEVHGGRTEFDGKPAILGTLLDVTEAREAEERAKWLATFPERNPNPIVELDPASGQIHYINPAAYRTFPELHAEGMTHPLLAGLADAAAILAEGATETLRRDVTLGDHYFSQTINYIKDARRVRVYNNDITARRIAEDAVHLLNAALEDRVRERTAQLEGANKEMEAFSYTVSHDLRAPLRHIHGYVEMLQRATEGQLSEKAERYLQVITGASTQMGQLIDDLLAFSRTGRTEMHLRSIDLNALILETLRDLEMSTRDRDIAWEIAPLPVVEGDRAMLKLVFTNLLSNAVKYTRPRNPARISVGCLGEDGGRVKLFVRDNGVGFDMKYVEKLFGVFQRLHRADEFEGTGIGLATVRRIITKHGGTVQAESMLDAGATFVFTLKPSSSEPA